MENRPAHPNLRKELDRIQQQWDKLRREVVDRQTRLQTAMVSTAFNKTLPNAIFLPLVSED